MYFDFVIKRINKKYIYYHEKKNLVLSKIFIFSLHIHFHSNLNHKMCMKMFLLSVFWLKYFMYKCFQNNHM